MSGDGVRPVLRPPQRGREQCCHQVNRTGTFSGRFPGVVKSGLSGSERGWASEKTKFANSRNVKGGRPFRLVPERTDYSQRIPVQNDLQQRGFRTSRILREDVNESLISTRFQGIMKGLKHVCSILDLWINCPLCTVRSYSRIQLGTIRGYSGSKKKERVMYSSIIRKAGRGRPGTRATRILGFSVQLTAWQ